MKILGIDYGCKRIGIAIGDSDDKVAFPRDILPNDQNLLNTLMQMVKSENVGKVIVGLPITFAGDESSMSLEAAKFADHLEDFFLAIGSSVPVDFTDERCSSKTSKDAARLHGLSEKQFRGKVDSAAAAVLLQAYFDRMGNGE